MRRYLHGEGEQFGVAQGRGEAGTASPQAFVDPRGYGDRGVQVVAGDAGRLDTGYGVAAGIEQADRGLTGGGAAQVGGVGIAQLRSEGGSSSSGMWAPGVIDAVNGQP